jgi:hypothetical protein
MFAGFKSTHAYEVIHGKAVQIQGIKTASHRKKKK